MLALLASLKIVRVVVALREMEAPPRARRKKWIHENLETLIPLLSDASVCRIEDVGPTYVEEGAIMYSATPQWRLRILAGREGWVSPMFV